MKRLGFALLLTTACTLYPSPGPYALYLCNPDGSCDPGYSCVVYGGRSVCVATSTSSGTGASIASGTSGTSTSASAGTSSGTTSHSTSASGSTSGTTARSTSASTSATAAGSSGTGGSGSSGSSGTGSSSSGAASSSGSTSGSTGGSTGLSDAGTATLSVVSLNGGPLVDLASGLDDGNIYASGRSIWILTSSGAQDVGDALAEAVVLGNESGVGFRPLRFGEVAGTLVVAVARHSPTVDDVALYASTSNGARFSFLAAFPGLDAWAFVPDPVLGPTVYVLSPTAAGNGTALTAVYGDGGELPVPPVSGSSWGCNDLASAPDSGELFVTLNDQGNVEDNQLLVIENVGGVPMVLMQLALGAVEMPNPDGGCRTVGPIAWSYFFGEAGFHSESVNYWDGSNALASLDNVNVLSDGGFIQHGPALDAGVPLSITLAPDLDYLVASADNNLYSQPLSGATFGGPRAIANQLPATIRGLAAGSTQVLARTDVGLLDITQMAVIDGGGSPQPGDQGLYGQVIFGAAQASTALYALGGSDPDMPEILQDVGFGLEPFAPPVGDGCGFQAPVDDTSTLVFCDGGQLYLVNGSTPPSPAGTAQGPLVSLPAADGGVWLFTETTPVFQASYGTSGVGGFVRQNPLQGPVWASPLSGSSPLAYARTASGAVAIDPNGSATPVSAPPFAGAGVVSPLDGHRFAGADAVGGVLSCVYTPPSSVSCLPLCTAADPQVKLAFDGTGALWILSQSGALADPAELPAGQSHLAMVPAAELGLGGPPGSIGPPCPLVQLSYPDPAAPEALLGLAVRLPPSPGSSGSPGTIYVQGSRHLLILSP